VEGALAKKTGNLTRFSEQNLVDCAKGPGINSDGCNGGLMTEGFDYVQKNGVNLEAVYPYEAVDTNGCRFNAAGVLGHIAGHKDIPQSDEKALENAVGTVGPVSVAIDAGSFYFQSYSGGIYDDFFCSADGLNHGVTAVGYGKNDKGQEYWIVKNSWGDAWGDKGYINIAKGKNMCGIAEMASYPVV